MSGDQIDKRSSKRHKTALQSTKGDGWTTAAGMRHAASIVCVLRDKWGAICQQIIFQLQIWVSCSSTSAQTGRYWQLHGS
jgi:hypothetical protein